MSAEQTYDRDLDDPRAMERELLRLAERTSRRLQKAKLVAGTVQVKIRRADFSTCTRQMSLQPAGNGCDRLFMLAKKLLRAWLRENSGARVRLLGVAGSSLGPVNQADLFAGAPAASPEPMDGTINEIRDRFGDGALARARTLQPHQARRGKADRE